MSPVFSQCIFECAPEGTNSVQRGRGDFCMIGLRGTGRLWRATAGTRSTVVVDEWFGLKAAVELDVPSLRATSRLVRTNPPSMSELASSRQARIARGDISDLHYQSHVSSLAPKDTAWTRIAARTIPHAPFTGSAAVPLAVRGRSGSGRSDPRCKNLHLAGGTLSHTCNRSDTRGQDCSSRQQRSHSCGDNCFAVQWLRGVCRVLEFACPLYRGAMG